MSVGLLCLIIKQADQATTLSDGKNTTLQAKSLHAPIDASPKPGMNLTPHYNIPQRSYADEQAIMTPTANNPQASGTSIFPSSRVVGGVANAAYNGVSSLVQSGLDTGKFIGSNVSGIAQSALDASPVGAVRNLGSLAGRAVSSAGTTTANLVSPSTQPAPTQAVTQPTAQPTSQPAVPPKIDINALRAEANTNIAPPVQNRVGWGYSYGQNEGKKYGFGVNDLLNLKNDPGALQKMPPDRQLALASSMHDYLVREGAPAQEIAASKSTLDKLKAAAADPEAAKDLMAAPPNTGDSSAVSASAAATPQSNGFIDGIMQFITNNPHLSGAIGVGGGTLLTLLMHRLFSGGQAQPVVNNYYQGQPQQLSYGAMQNRNNLLV